MGAVEKDVTLAGTVRPLSVWGGGFLQNFRTFPQEKAKLSCTVSIITLILKKRNSP